MNQTWPDTKLEVTICGNLKNRTAQSCIRYHGFHGVPADNSGGWKLQDPNSNHVKAGPGPDHAVQVPLRSWGPPFKWLKVLNPVALRWSRWFAALMWEARDLWKWMIHLWIFMGIPTLTYTHWVGLRVGHSRNSQGLSSCSLSKLQFWGYPVLWGFIQNVPEWQINISESVGRSPLYPHWIPLLVIKTY